MYLLMKLVLLQIMILLIGLLGGCVKPNPNIVLRMPQNFAILRPWQQECIFFYWDTAKNNVRDVLYEFELQQVCVMEYDGYWEDVVTLITNSNDFYYPLALIQGGRWRVREITENGDGKWSDYCYFAIPQIEAIIYELPKYRHKSEYFQ